MKESILSEYVRKFEEKSTVTEKELFEMFQKELQRRQRQIKPEYFRTPKETERKKSS
jgi:hypothetical protein